MRLIRTTLLIFIISLSACKKEVTNQIIAGVTDVNLVIGMVELEQRSLKVLKGTNKQDEVTMSVTGLPLGINHQFSKDKGIAPFNTTVTFSINSQNVVAGSYPINIVSTNTQGHTTTQSLTINVSSNCSREVPGTYDGFKVGSNSASYRNLSNIIIEKDQSSDNIIILKRFGPHFHPDFSAIINCIDSSITLVPETVTTINGDEYYSGNGSYSITGQFNFILKQAKMGINQVADTYNTRFVLNKKP